MKRMKKSLALLFCIGMFLLVFGTIPTQAATFKWEISGVQLEHEKISFTIGQVEKAQNAAVVVMNSQKEEILSLDFSISNQKEDIVIDLAGEECLRANSENEATKTEYYLYVKDGEGNIATDTYQVYLQHHEYYQVTVAAYPNWVEIREFKQDGMHASVSVNFQEYEGEQDENGEIIIRYPRQKDETYVQVKWWDDYGCSGMRDLQVASESYIFLPQLEVFRESTKIVSESLRFDRRLAVKIGDEVYYSSYGVGCYENAVTYPEIPKGISSVTAWVECENGSRSNESTYDISHCNLESCKYGIQSYPGRTLGTVNANRYGQSVVSVSVTIGGRKYQADVKNGAFKLEYPNQKSHEYLKFIFTDAHGCSHSVRKDVVNTLHNSSVGEYVLKKNILKKSTSAEMPYNDMRLCVRIGGKTYYSKYSGKRNETVRASYPQQKVGTPIIIWVEHKNTSHTKEAKREIYDREIKYSVKAKPKELSGKYLSNKKAKIFVTASGKEYKCKMVKKWDFDYGRYYYNFSVSYPQQKVNSYIKLKITDEDGYSRTGKIKLKNIPPKLSVASVDSGSVKITGKTAAGSKVTVQIKGKKYKGKANKSGKYTVKIKQAKVGTKVKVSVVTPEGYIKSKTVKVKLADGSVNIPNYIFKTSNSITIEVSGGQKGDKLKVNVGGAIYAKTIKKTKKSQKVTVNINPAAAGTGVEVKLCDKFGKVKHTFRDMVFFGDSIYVGMSAEEACLTTWGLPRRNNYGGLIQWVFRSGSTTLYVYIRDGRVAYMQELNY